MALNTCLTGLDNVQRLQHVARDENRDGRLSIITTDNVWLGCFAHNLKLGIAKAFNIQKVDTPQRVCRHLVQGFPGKRELKKQQTILELPEKSLIHDVTTWRSTFKMIEKYLKLQACYAGLAADRKMWHLMPKGSDVQTLERVCQLLEPLNVFIDLLTYLKTMREMMT